MQFVIYSFKGPGRERIHALGIYERGTVFTFAHCFSEKSVTFAQKAALL